MTMTSASTPATEAPLAIATRLHLGHASHPPPNLRDMLTSFITLAQTIGANHAVIAVDAAERITGYDLVDEVTKICNPPPTDLTPSDNNVRIHILPVTPWGKFVPALNAIVSHVATLSAKYVLMTSAEVQLSQDVLTIMKSKLDLEKTLVVGTVLPGHDYRYSRQAAVQNEEVGASEKVLDDKGVEVELTGRTTPWNTCSLWNVSKLSLTGFLLVSEGLHPEEDGSELGSSAGVEEVCTIATLQRILGPGNAQAKLITLPGEESTSWETQNFENDAKRKDWHEKKMASKVSRAKRQLELLGLSGTVIHC
ncbi:hypothetical protein ACHAWU_007070 [Discostella pseudostelligera]|uniref:Uncharacterized protein n=1 Tax=Discostella pseudostelligera TaxID=259834 RepID=A0ABD3N162_9STRA